MSLYDQRCQCHRSLPSSCGSVDQGAYWRVLNTDGPDPACQRSQPMGGVDHIRAGNTGKQILSAAGKANYLMREGRSNDQNMIVFEHQLIDSNGDLIGQGWMQAVTGDLPDFSLIHGTERSQHSRVVPGMVEQANVPVFSAAFIM